MAGPSGTILVAKPSGYIALTSGFQIRSTFSAASLATSAVQVRGYEPKSSVGANCAGLTKIETTTLVARRLARRTSEICPSWSAPMVGTSATVAFLARRPSSARRKAGTVRTTMGFRDIGARSIEGGKAISLAAWRRGGGRYQGRPPAAKLWPATACGEHFLNLGVTCRTNDS